MPTAKQPSVQSWLPVAVSISALALALYVAVSGWKGAESDRVRALELSVAVLKNQMDTVLSNSLQRALDAGTILHRPEPQFKERDALLVKWGQHELDEEGKTRLMQVLTDVLGDKDQPDGARSLAAEILRAMQQQYRDQPGEPPSTRGKPN